MHDFGDGVKGAGFKLKEMGEDGRGTAGNEARSAQTGRTGRTAQTARAAQPIAVAARTVCAADWAALPWANRPYGRRQLPEHAMSAPFQKVHFFCLFGKIWFQSSLPSSDAVPKPKFWT